MMMMMSSASRFGPESWGRPEAGQVFLGAPFFRLRRRRQRPRRSCGMRGNLVCSVRIVLIRFTLAAVYYYRPVSVRKSGFIFSKSPANIYKLLAIEIHIRSRIG